MAFGLFLPFSSYCIFKRADLGVGLHFTGREWCILDIQLITSHIRYSRSMGSIPRNSVDWDNSLRICLHVRNKIPYLDISDILLDVDVWTNQSRYGPSRNSW